MMVRLTGSLCVAVIAFSAACAHPRIANDSFHGCGITAVGATRLTRHDSPSLDPAAQSAQLGAMVFHVAGGAPLQPVRLAFVDLLADTTALHRMPAIRSGTADSVGTLRWDAVPVGRYGLLVRVLGFEILRRPVTVRAGGVDTLVVSLRTTALCHNP